MNLVSYAPQTFFLPQDQRFEEEIFGTCNLDGKDVQLVRVGDQLQARVVYPLCTPHITHIKVQPPLSNLPIEQLMEYVLTLNFLVRDDDTVECQITDETLKKCEEFGLRKLVSSTETNSLNQEENLTSKNIVKAWKLDNGNVFLVKSGDRLEAKVRYPTGSDGSFNVPFPDRLSIDQAIQIISNEMFPVITDVGIDFKRIPKPVEISAAVNSDDEYECKDADSHISKLDGRSEINNDIWAVTLVDLVACERLGTRHARRSRAPKTVKEHIDNSNDNSSTWGGHAAVYIEQVKNNRYKLSLAHLTFAGVIMNVTPLDRFRPERIVSKSVTWLRPKEVVKKMIDAIKWQEREQINDRPTVFLDQRGQGAIGVSADESVMNCYDYACSILALAGVHLRKERSLLEKIGIRPLAVLPKKHISPNSLSSKEPILVRIEVDLFQTAGFFSKSYHETIVKTLDLRDEINRDLGGTPWRIVTETGDVVESNRILSIIKTKIRVEREDKGYSLDFRIDKVLLPLEVDGEFRLYDATSIVRHRIETLTKSDYVKNDCSVM